MTLAFSKSGEYIRSFERKLASLHVFMCVLHVSFDATKIRCFPDRSFGSVEFSCGDMSENELIFITLVS